jgi:hypothetical protein
MRGLRDSIKAWQLIGQAKEEGDHGFWRSASDQVIRFCAEEHFRRGAGGQGDMARSTDSGATTRGPFEGFADGGD